MSPGMTRGIGYHRFHFHSLGNKACLGVEGISSWVVDEVVVAVAFAVAAFLLLLVPLVDSSAAASRSLNPPVLPFAAAGFDEVS